MYKDEIGGTQQHVVLVGRFGGVNELLLYLYIYFRRRRRRPDSKISSRISE